MRSLNEKLLRNALLISLLLAYSIATTDFQKLQTGGYSTGLETSASSFLKILKDLFYLVLFLLLLQKKPFFTAITMLAGLILIAPAVVFTSYENGMTRALFGIRWFYPFLLAISLYILAPRQIFSKNGRNLIILAMTLNLLAQLFQTFISPPKFFVGDDGVLSRAPGIFFLPSASSIIMCISYLYISTSMANSKNQQARYFSLLLLISSIYFSDSATAMMILLVIIGYELKVLRNSIFGLLGSIGFITIGLLLATIISPRGDQLLDRSAGNRVALLIDNFSKFDIISTNFGSYTSAGIMLGGKGYSSLESTIGALFGNLGILPGALCLALFFYMMAKAVHTNRNATLVIPAATIIFGAFLAVNVFEFFPLGALMFILIKNVR